MAKPYTTTVAFAFTGAAAGVWTVGPNLSPYIGGSIISLQISHNVAAAAPPVNLSYVYTGTNIAGGISQPIIVDHNVYSAYPTGREYHFYSPTSVGIEILAGFPFLQFMNNAIAALITAGVVRIQPPA